MKTLRNILDKKDAEIIELQNKLKKLDTDVKTNEELKKQIHTLKRSNEELKTQIKALKDQVEHYKKTYEKIQSLNDKIIDDFKIKEEFIQDIKSLLKTQDYVDCYINVNDGRYPAHKCIISARSGVLKSLIEAAASPSSSVPMSQASPAPLPPPSQNKDPRLKNNKKEPRPQNSVESQSQFVQTPKTELRSFVNSNTLELKELDPMVMPFIFNYIYSGETEHITDRNVQSIMKAADMLELSGLRTSCLVFMEGKLSRLTCIPILIEAFELNHERLKKKCLQFIQDEKIDLTNSNQWVEFKN